MSAEWIQILAAGMAGCGFAIMFHIKPKYLPLLLLGASLGWFDYLWAEKAIGIRSMSMIMASMAVTVYSEIFARIVKMPVSVIYTPAVIPMIPGSNLYYCMRGFVTGSHENFMKYGGLLLEDTLGIVLGTLIVLTVVSAHMAKKRRS